MIANRGTQYQPHLIKEIENQNHFITFMKPTVIHTVSYKKSTWDYIIKAMKNVTIYGTGHHFGKTKYPVASKTGTAQIIENSNYTTPTSLQDHSLFIAFAPIKNPKVALAVVVENHRNAPEISKEFLDAYFKYYPEKTNG